MHLGSAPRIPCPLRRFVPALFSCCRRRLCYLGLPMSTGDTLHYYSGIHTPALRCQLLSSPLCAFLGFLLLRHYVRMSTNPLPSVVYLHGRRSFEAARNDASLGLRLFLPKHTHMPTIPFDVLPRRSGTPRRVFSACFLRSGSSVMASVKNMIPCVE